MTREQKVKALQAIAAGSITPKELNEAPKIVAWQDYSPEAKGWQINGHWFTDADYLQRLAAYRATAARLAAIGSDAGYFITVKYKSK